MSPPPDGEHEEDIAIVIKAIMRHSDVEMSTFGTKGLITPVGRFIPDLTVAPDGTFKHAEPWAPCDGVELVCEVTSSNPDNDRGKKRLGYAQAGIPLYLLVDRTDEAAYLFSEPDGKDYQDVQRVHFGKELRLPKPFDVDIDTAKFA